MKYWNATFLERLLQVQSTDLKIRKLDAQIQFYYQRSKEEDSELTRLKMEISEVDTNIESMESQNQMYSTTLDDIRTAIKGLMTTKSGVPKPRTRSSTEALKIEEDKLSTLVEDTVEQLAKLRDDRETLIERASDRAEILEKTQEGPEAEIRKLQVQIKKLEKQREGEIEGLPPTLLKHYDRLRSSRSGIGLTILRDGVCTVCRMQMPTAVISRMSKGERVPICPACGRMVARIEIINLIPNDDEAAASEKASKVKSKKEITTKTKTAAKAKAAAASKTAKEITEPPPKAAMAKKTSAKRPAEKKAARAPVEKTAVTAEKTPKKAEEKTTSKAATKKEPAKKPAEKKPAAKKEPAKKPAEKKPASKKAPAKKPAEKKPASKKAPAKKSEPAKAAKSAPAAKKGTAKKPAAKKPAAKKAAKKK